MNIRRNNTCSGKKSFAVSTKRIISLLVISLFLVNELTYAMPFRENVDSSNTLQVQSIFKPILDRIGHDNAEILRVETAMVLAMVLQDVKVPYYEVNAELDKWYSGTPEKHRLLDVLPYGIRENDGRATVTVNVLHGPYKGNKLRILSNCCTIEDIQDDESHISIELADENDSLFNQGVLKKGYEKTARGEEFSPFMATDDFYSLREEAEKGMRFAGSVSSIGMDSSTGDMNYFSEGNKTISLKAHVYVKEGASWDLPIGVALPGYLSSLINGDAGALVLMTGPFYDKVEGATVADFIRPLTDEEVYARYGLRRVHGRDNEPFTMPVLGIAGRSILLPVSYSVATVRTDSGVRLVRNSDDSRQSEQQKYQVFGLEFKNAGTPAYEKHNINPSFPATIIRKYVGKSGIFLNWWHQLRTKEPVGLGRDHAPPIPRETDVLDDGASLTRWTLANITLEAPYVITLRAPIGDYRRLSVFFDINGEGQIDLFNAIISELGFGSAGEYFKAMCQNYGRNMRSIVKKNIMESSHGSMINTDILGNITDLGDFWEIAGKNEPFLKHGVDARIDNLVKVLDLVGEDNKNVRDSALKEFATAYFRGDEDVNAMEIDADNPSALKDAVYRHALNIVKKAEESVRVDSEVSVDALNAPEKKAMAYIKNANGASLMVFSGLRRYISSIFLDDVDVEDMMPVNIVVDLSLISGADRSDMENNVHTWAQLILICHEFDNVHFTFKHPYPVNYKTMSEGLVKNIKNDVSEEYMLALLEKKIRDLSSHFGEDIDVNSIMDKKINSAKMKKAIEIPILSKDLLEWVRENNMQLGPDQFPVAMDGLPVTENKEAAFRNFEAALAIGLSKAVLVMAKKRGKGIRALEEEELKKVMDDTCILSRLQRLYGVLFDGRVEITERTLRNMVYDDARTRLNLAISLAIPPVIRMPVEKLRKFHSAMHDLLMAA